MTDPITDAMIARALQLVDALCVINCGWRTEEEGLVYAAAQRLVGERAVEIDKEEEIKRLKARIEELESKHD